MGTNQQVADAKRAGTNSKNFFKNSKAFKKQKSVSDGFFKNSKAVKKK